ncbi:MAG TPA: M23 family metallopeptidase [Alphaproteobacteria bacterium]|jgi:hypothetical protein|nr:M23 family metallopeptidase [Alphaproteobacteria bacterium]
MKARRFTLSLGIILVLLASLFSVIPVTGKSLAIDAGQFRVPVIGDFTLTQMGGVAGCGTHIGSGNVGSKFMDINLQGTSGNEDAGTPIYASGDGTIKDVLYSASGFGQYVIEESNGVKFLYAHLARVYAYNNQSIGKGQLIGVMGNSGMGAYSGTHSAHLHWEAWPVNGGSFNIFDIPNVNEDTTPCSGTNDGSVTGSPVPNNSNSSCSDFSNQGLQKVALFDNTNCRGNFITLDGDPSGARLYGMTSGSLDFNDRPRSIYIPSGWTIRVGGNSNDSSPVLTKCFTSTQTNLDTVSYDQGRKIGYDWANDMNGWNMISYVVVARTGGCNAVAGATGGFVVASPNTGNGGSESGSVGGAPVPGHVEIFNGSECGGTQFGWQDPTDGWFDLTSAHGETASFMNNSASCIRTDSGWSVIAASEFQGGGGKKCYSGSAIDLVHSEYDNGSNMNDNVSSVRVYNDTTCGGFGVMPTGDLTYKVLNPGNRIVEMTLTWSNAGQKWQIVNFGDGTDHGMFGSSGSTTITHQYNPGNYTITFNVSSDWQTSTVTKSISAPSFECGSAATQTNITLYEFENCSYVTEANFAQFPNPGVYNLADYNLDNKVSSIHFPASGRSAKLYEGPNKTGESYCLNWDKWYMPLDTWPSGAVMENTISSLEVFDTIACTPHPTMSITPVFLDPHGQIQLNTNWSGGCNGCWQIITWGDGTNYGMQGASGNKSPTKWYPGPGTYTIKFTVQNANPDWGFYTTQQNVTVNSFACGNAVKQSGVILYRFSTCAYRDVSDYERFTSTGAYNLSIMNNQVTSLHIPTGKSVRIYQGINRTGVNKCVKGDMWAMDIDKWSNGTTINDSISSIQIFSNTTCTP